MYILHSIALSLLVLSASAWQFRVDVKPNVETKASKDWDMLKLTQTWPPAACIYIQNEDKKCNISSKTTGWMIHGLWPTQSGTQGPNFCNDTWKFNVDEVQVLRPRLDYNWPSITEGEKPEDTWKHEWEKHGTCGASLDEIKDQLHYFNYTLSLQERFNLTRMLAQAGVIPSESKLYSPDNILDVLKNALGFSPSITCVKEKGTENFYLEQVEVCLSKAFQPIGCTTAQSKFSPRAPAGRPNDLRFVPENLVQSRLTSNPDIHDCGSGQVIYKPIAPTRK